MVGDWLIAGGRGIRTVGYWGRRLCCWMNLSSKDVLDDEVGGEDTGDAGADLSSSDELPLIWQTRNKIQYLAFKLKFIDELKMKMVLLDQVSSAWLDLTIEWSEDVTEDIHDLVVNIVTKISHTNIIHCSTITWQTLRHNYKSQCKIIFESKYSTHYFCDWRKMIYLYQFLLDDKMTTIMNCVREAFKKIKSGFFPQGGGSMQNPKVENQVI